MFKLRLRRAPTACAYDEKIDGLLAILQFSLLSRYAR